MLLIPFVKTPDWRKPPVVTLLLILINVVVFVGFQLNDWKDRERANDYYFASDLPKLELPRYFDHLRKTGEEKRARKLEALLKDDERKAYALMWMERDAVFMRELRENRVVRFDEAAHTEWRRQRERYEDLASNVFTERFSFRSTEFDPITLISHMFLHGGWDHLIGNMVALALVGYLVEEVLGGFRYLGFYLLTGLGSILMYWRFHPDDAVLALGASGAISGVIAMYAVLFGLRRIKFFYWVLIYFNVMRARGIILLPFWLAYEVFQLAFTESNTNYLAHIGGLLGGTLLAGVYRQRNAAQLEAYHEQEEAQELAADNFPKDMAQARKHVANLEFDRALALYEHWQAQRPGDRELLVQCYSVARHEPKSDAFHRAAARILALKDRDPGTNELVHETFTEYLKLARPAARLSPLLLFALARRFSDDGFLEDADRLTGAVLRQNTNAPELPMLLLRLAHAWQRAGNQDKAAGWIAKLGEDFPDSEAARLAARAPGRA